MNIDEVAAKLGTNPRRFRETSQFLFAGVPLTGKRVVDVGAGRGATTMWAVLQGAEHVTALEPELDGSTPKSHASFTQLVADYGLGDRIDLRAVPLAGFESSQAFDVAVLNGVVNHLNEPAVVRLHRDPAAVDDFVATLRPLRALLRDGGTAIVADVGRRSIWRVLHVQGPWTQDIEWEKHQQPQTWIDVFRRVGFEPIGARWSPLRGTGRLTGNRIVQFFTMAHFVLHLRAV